MKPEHRKKMAAPIVITVLFVLKERIREIKSGEEDDLEKY